jgi:hypothetical protein
MSEAENSTMTHETAHPDEKTTEPSISLEESAFDANEETVEALDVNTQTDAAVSLDSSAIDVSEPVPDNSEVAEDSAPVMDETIEDIQVEAEAEPAPAAEEIAESVEIDETVVVIVDESAETIQVEEIAVLVVEAPVETADGDAAEKPEEKPAPEPEPLDLETIATKTTALEAELETAEHKASLIGRLTTLQEGLNGLEASEERAEIDARLASVQAAIAVQTSERAEAKEVIVARAESLVDSQDWKATSEAFREMQEELRGIGSAGKELDDPIWERFRAARSGFHEHRTAFFAERQKLWEESKVRKEALAAEAEALAEVEDFKDKSARARALMEEWKASGFAGREAEDELWPKFRGALDRFYERRSAFYEENKVKKEELAVKAEEISGSTDWRATGEAMRRLMEEWKTLGSAGREHDDPLWERFRGAQQVFYEARSAAFAERESSNKENIARKEELCAQAEAIADREDMRGAIQEVIALQAEWKKVGFIPRDKSDELWQRFKAASDRVFSHVDAERQERSQSREQGFKDAITRKREQYQRLNESIAHDQANINRWRDTISTLGGGARADQISTELENRVIEVMLRVREKQARAEDLQTDLKEMETRANPPA